MLAMANGGRCWGGSPRRLALKCAAEMIEPSPSHDAEGGVPGAKKQEMKDAIMHGLPLLRRFQRQPVLSLAHVGGPVYAEFRRRPPALMVRNVTTWRIPSGIHGIQNPALLQPRPRRAQTSSCDEVRRPVEAGHPTCAALWPGVQSLRGVAHKSRKLQNVFLGQGGKTA